MERLREAPADRGRQLALVGLELLHFAQRGFGGEQQHARVEGYRQPHRHRDKVNCRNPITLKAIGTAALMVVALDTLEK